MTVEVISQIEATLHILAKIEGIRQHALLHPMYYKSNGRLEGTSHRRTLYIVGHTLYKTLKIASGILLSSPLSLAVP